MSKKKEQAYTDDQCHLNCLIIFDFFSPFLSTEKVESHSSVQKLLSNEHDFMVLQCGTVRKTCQQ